MLYFNTNVGATLVVRTLLRGRTIGLVALANDIEYRLPALEDRRSDCLLHDLFRLPAGGVQRCNTTIPPAVRSAFPLPATVRRARRK